jgi:aspartyl-tRNA(Asn)/glutamyl-tRNA(Gln) amidotransferase subunit A
LRIASAPNPSPQGDPADLGVREAAAALQSRALSATELTEACLRRIDERNGGAPTFDGAPDAINAWARLYPEIAREQAAQADARRSREGAEAPALCGIPLGVKDLYGVAGLPLTASSRVLKDNVADADATVWARLRDQGMVLVGHTHTHEFAAGGTTDQVGNPWALNRVAGGSSGGSAAALAAGMVPAAIGSDTCGSLRIPSSCCGTSTIKPTHGALPLDGVIPLAPSLDHPGPMARTVADCGALLTAIGGLPTPSEPRPGRRPLEGMTIALTDRTESAEVQAPVATAFEQARRACESLGARVIEAAAPWAFDWSDLSVILLTEVWRYHEQFAERHDRYRPAIAEFVEASQHFTHPEPYDAAQARRDEGAAIWEQWFKDGGIDAVLEPTLPIEPHGRGPGYDGGHAGGVGDPMIALTALWNLTRMPVVALAVTWSAGVSLIAPTGREAPLVQAAIDLQEHALAPPAWTP